MTASWSTVAMLPARPARKQGTKPNITSPHVSKKQRCSSLVRTVGYVAVAAILNGVAEAVLDALVARKVKRVSRTCPQYSNLEASEGPQEALGRHDLFQSPVHAAVLSLRVWL